MIVAPSNVTAHTARCGFLPSGRRWHNIDTRPVRATPLPNTAPTPEIAMRFTLAALAIALTLPVAAADDEAKAAFAKMETTVRKAKSFQTEFQTTTTIGK